jgi:tetratricopeptide (TPR) repeat protein
VRLEAGQALYSEGRTSQAVDQWRIARAAPYLARQADGISDLEQREAWLRLALRIDAANADARIALAEVDLSEGRYAEARGALRRQLEAGRLDAGSRAYAHLLLGVMAYRLDGDPAAALAQLRAAIEAAPWDESLYRAVVRVLDDSGRSEEAGQYLARADNLVSSGGPSDTLGHAYEAVGDSIDAAAEYGRVGSGPRADPIGRYDLGRLRIASRDLRQGIPELQAAVRAIPNQEDFRLALARAYVLDGALSGAVQEYRAVLALDPGNLEARRAGDALALHAEQAVSHDFEVFHGLAGADGHAVERMLGYVARDAGDGREELVDIAQQRAAAGHDHALVHDV